MKHKFKQTAIRTLFILYTGIMLYLLFVQRLLNSDLPALYSEYGKSLSERFEPVPFGTIREFIGSLEAFSLSDPAFRNLAGNIVLFIPIGLFLPARFMKQQKFGTFLLTVIITICAVELIQMLTILGICDIDDLILNTAGACIGFFLYKSIQRELRKLPTARKEP